MNLSKAFTVFEKDKKALGYSQKTLESYRIQNNLVIRHFGDLPINELKYIDLKEYVQKDSDRLKPSSVGHRIKYLKSFFRWAVEEEVVLRNPASKLREPRLGKNIPKFLTEHQIELLRSKCKNALDRAVLEVAYSTGGRVLEIHNLNIKDVDFANRTITLMGKGEKERFVFFDPTCKFWLEKYLDSRADDCEALFVTERKPTRRSSTEQLRHIVKRVAKRTGIEESVFPHRYRHSLATHLIDKGADIGFIQKLLGHSRIKTTEIYANASNVRLRQQYDQHR